MISISLRKNLFLYGFNFFKKNLFLSFKILKKIFLYDFNFFKKKIYL